jgi:translocation and assembly module TamB
MKGRRIIVWTLAIVVIFTVVVAVGGYLFLKSHAFQQYAIHKIVDTANEATGGRTQIGGLDFSLSTLTAHLYNIVVRGSENLSQPPLLRVDKLTVGLKIKSALQRKVTLSELLVEHPVVHMQIDRQGKSNLPQAPPSQSSSKTSVFDLAVGHVQLARGEVNYNDLQTPVDADLYNLNTDIHFNALTTSYSGSISYDNGHLHYAQYAPMPHNFSAKFSATPSVFALESAVMRVGASEVSVHAQATNYSNPLVAGEYVVRIHTQDFASMSRAVKPAGDVALTGQVRYQEQDNQPLLRKLRISGQIDGAGLSATSPDGRLDIRRLQGHYQLANGGFESRDLEVDSLGGRVKAEIEIAHLDTTPSSRVQAALRGVSLKAVQQAIHRPGVKQVAVSGTLDGTAQASWTGSITNLQARSDLNLHAAASDTTHVPASEVPVDGAIHVSYDGAREVIALRQTRLHLPSTSVMADGQVSKRSSLHVQLKADDLHQLVMLASSFGGNSAPPEVSGSAVLNLMVQGSIHRPRLAGQLGGSNLRVQGSEWRTMDAALDANPSQFTISKATLVSAQRGQASFSASVGLQNWAYLASNPIKANLSVQRMSVADLQRLANQHYPVSGELSASLSVRGTQLNPTGSGSAQLTNAQAYDEPIQTLALNFHAENGSVSSTLNVAVAAGSAKADLSYTPSSKTYKVSLDAPSIALQKLHTVQAKNLAVSGKLSASARGEGTIDDPQLAAVLEVPQLEMQGKTISGIKAEMHVANHRADLTLDSKVVESSVKARAQVNLTGDYYTDASIDTTVVPLDVLMATYAGRAPEGFQGQSEFHATLKGPLKNSSQVEAHLTIPALSASYQSLQIGIANPIRADYSHSVVTLQPVEIRGTGTSLRLLGNIPLAGPTAPSFTAQGTLDVQVLQIVAPDVHSSGTVALDIRASGSAAQPAVQGQVHLKDIAVSTTEAPLGIEKMNGTLDIGNDRVKVSGLTAQVGGGQVSLGGSVAYRPSLEFNLALNGKSVRLRYPDGLRTVLDSHLAFSGNAQSSTLNGRVLIDTLAFTPGFDLATFSDQFSENTATPAQPGFADNVRLAIGVQSKENLSATSSQISLEGHVDLQVIGTAANPVIIGRTDLTAGELFYRNVRYQLERGIITFDNPDQTAPVLNVSVTTTIKQYNLTLDLRGPFDKLTTSYTSDPPLATADIISLVSFGKTTQEPSQSTDSMIASGAVSQVAGGVQKLAGISSLEVDPLIGGNNQNPSARVAIQQRVTKNFLFTFSTDVSQPGTEMVQGDYQLTKRWSVSVARDQVGGVSVDGRFHTRF